MKARWLHIHGHEGRDYYVLGVDRPDGSFKTYAHTYYSAGNKCWYDGPRMQIPDSENMTLVEAKIRVERRLREYYRAYKDLESL